MQQPRGLILFFVGLIEYGGGTKVITVNGLALPPYFQVSVMSVISFLFGTGAAKVTK